MAVSTSSLESIAGNLLFRCGLCQESDMTLQEGFSHCLQGHSRDQTEAYNIQCADCSVGFPCKAFFMLPRLHNPGCRMQPDQSLRSVSGTTSGSILLFDAEVIQDVQSVANPSRTLPDTTVLQFGDSTSLAENVGVSAYLFPTSASFQASQQAEASAQVSSGSVMCAYATDGSAAHGPETASVAARSVIAENTDLKRRNMYRCDTCGKSFISSKGLQIHTRRSACQQRKCRLCDFQCETYQNLDKHGELDHKGKDDYMYMCPLCNKGFKKREFLQIHTRRSACQQRKCRLCDFQCETCQDLDEHCELAHTGRDDYMYMCLLCNKGFKKKRGLTDHRRHQHR